jgi:hypothetical protein
MRKQGSYQETLKEMADALYMSIQQFQVLLKIHKEQADGNKLSRLTGRMWSRLEILHTVPGGFHRVRPT